MTDAPSISVTIKRKQSENFAQDGAWTNFVAQRAVQVQDNLIEFFGLDRIEGETPAETALRAERVLKTLDANAVRPLKRPATVAGESNYIVSSDEGQVLMNEPTPEQAVENVVTGLDGTVVEDDDDPWKSSRGEAEPGQGLGEPKDELLEAIQQADSKSALRNLHSSNVELFKEDKYKDALKARAKEVS